MICKHRNINLLFIMFYTPLFVQYLFFNKLFSFVRPRQAYFLYKHSIILEGWLAKFSILELINHFYISVVSISPNQKCYISQLSTFSSSEPSHPLALALLLFSSLPLSRLARIFSLFFPLGRQFVIVARQLDFYLYLKRWNFAPNSVASVFRPFFILKDRVFGASWKEEFRVVDGLKLLKRFNEKS